MPANRPISLYDFAPRESRRVRDASDLDDGSEPKRRSFPFFAVGASVVVAVALSYGGLTLDHSLTGHHTPGGSSHNQNNSSHEHHPKVLTPVALVALATQTARVDKAGVASVNVSCTKADCDGSVTLTDGTARVGFAAIHLSPKGDATVAVTLNSHGRALMKSSAKDRLATHASFTLGNHAPVSSYLLLQGPPKPVVPPPTTTLPQRTTTTLPSTTTSTTPRSTTTTTQARSTTTTTTPAGPPSLVLYPPSTYVVGNNTVNQVTAQLTIGGRPAAGKTVVFTVTKGCSPGSITRTTNGSGSAEASFSCPPSVGSPVIRATSDGVSTSVQGT